MSDRVKFDLDMEVDKSVIDLYSKAHKSVFEVWEHGEPVESWWDEDSLPYVLCIKYEDGRWWHYKTVDSKVVWF